MDRPDESQLAKLPTWARKYIENAERERDIAIKRLEEFQDFQSKSEFFYEENYWTHRQRGPETVTRYIQTRRVICEFEGVRLEVYLRDDHIDLSWGEAGTYQSGEVAFIPTSFMQARLVHPSRLRFRSPTATRWEPKRSEGKNRNPTK